MAPSVRKRARHCDSILLTFVFQSFGSYISQGGLCWCPWQCQFLCGITWSICDGLHIGAIVQRRCTHLFGFTFLVPRHVVELGGVEPRHLPEVGVAHAVLSGVQEDVLPVGHHGPYRGVQHGHLRLELLHLLFEEGVLFPHGVDADLGHQEVLGLGGALHSNASRDEFLRGQLPRFVVVQQGKDLSGIINGEIDHLQLVVNLRFLDRTFHLFQLQSATAIHIRHFKNLLQLSKDLFPISFPSRLQLVLILVGRRQGVFHHDSYHDAHQTQTADAHEDQEEDQHGRLVGHHVSHHTFIPLIQSHDLKQGKGRSPNRGEVDFVIPTTGLGEVGVIQLVVVSNDRGADDSAGIAKEQRHQTDPAQGLQ
mmetsp:Transcript_19360/g.32514  ORF Transcript_19360/g.32514 Transcript_19360/m.32514 type:complete len:365 (+) Transcript_19360:79-1173(+)